MPIDSDAEKQAIRDSRSDPQRFEVIYVKYYEPILRFVYKRMEDLDDCRDVTSSVFTKALMNIGKYREMGLPFSSWLYRIALNEIAQFYRRSSKQRVISIDDQSILSLAAESGTQKELLNILKKALQYLSGEELNLIELCFFENRSFAEMGQILLITEANAKVRTYRVIDKLKKIYKKLSG